MQSVPLPAGTCDSASCLRVPPSHGDLALQKDAESEDRMLSSPKGASEVDTIHHGVRTRQGVPTLSAAASWGEGGNFLRQRGRSKGRG